MNILDASLFRSHILLRNHRRSWPSRLIGSLFCISLQGQSWIHATPKVCEYKPCKIRLLPTLYQHAGKDLETFDLPSAGADAYTRFDGQLAGAVVVNTISLVDEPCRWTTPLHLVWQTFVAALSGEKSRAALFEASQEFC